MNDWYRFVRVGVCGKDCAEFLMKGVWGGRTGDGKEEVGSAWLLLVDAEKEACGRWWRLTIAIEGTMMPTFSIAFSDFLTVFDVIR